MTTSVTSPSVSRFTAEFLQQHFEYIQKVSRQFSLMEKHGERRADFAGELASTVVEMLIPKIDKMDSTTRELISTSAPFRNTMLRNLFKDAKDKLWGNNHQDRFEASHQLLPDDSDFTSSNNPEDDLLAEERRDLLLAAVRALPHDEARVINFTFGLNDETPLSQIQIGEELGLCQSQISRLLVSGLARLKKSGVGC